MPEKTLSQRVEAEEINRATSENIDDGLISVSLPHPTLPNQWIPAYVKRGDIGSATKATEVSNDSDAFNGEKVSDALASAKAQIDLKIAMSEKGIVNGVAPLGAEGKVTYPYIKRTRNEYSIEDFGAVCDYEDGDGTDNTSAILNAIDFLDSSGSGINRSGRINLIVPANCKITDQIVIPNGINLICEGTIYYHGPQDRAVLSLFGSTSKVTRLKIRSATLSDWEDESYVGAELINFNASEIYLDYALRFGIGFRLIGDNAGFVYNYVYIGEINSNKIALDLTNRNGGWCNENSYHKGQLRRISIDNPGKTCYGVRITSEDGSYVNNNNNTFYSTSFELNHEAQTGSAEAYPVLIEHGLYNAFLNYRAERNSEYFMVLRNNARANILESGYEDVSPDGVTGKPRVLYEGNYRGTELSRPGGQWRHADVRNRLIFHSGQLIDRSCEYGNGDYWIMGCDGSLSSSASRRSTILASGGLSFGEDYINIPSGRGVSVRIKGAGEFTLLVDSVSGYRGRVGIRCYNASGEVIGAADNILAYGSPASEITWNSIYGGIFYKNSDLSLRPFSFFVDPSVSEFDVLLVGSTNPLRIKSFSIYAPTEVSVSCLQGSRATALGAVDLPQEGTYLIGTQIHSMSPDSGPTGWVCTQSGTQGNISITGGITSGTRELEVSDASDLVVGQYITIAGVTGIKRIRAISGTTITLDSNANATVEDADVTFSAAVFLGIASDPEELDMVETPYVVYDSGTLAHSSCENGDGSIWCGGLYTFTTSEYNPLPVRSGISVDGSVISLPSTRGVGVNLRTDTSKTFLAVADILSETVGRISIVCFAANGDILGGDSPAYVTGIGQAVFYFGSTYGGSYRKGSDSKIVRFSVHSDVHSISVIFGGIGAVDLRKIVIYAASNYVAWETWGSLRGLVSKMAALDVPDSGTFLQGRRITNYAPSSGQPASWVCTQSGTQGSISITGGITSGTATLVVSSATDLLVGQYITIAGVSGIKRIRAISGTTITLDSNADATVAGADVDFSNAVFLVETTLP